MVQIPLELEPQRGGPLYRRLYEALAGQIRAGSIPAGTRLPGKRALAAELSVSVNTVDTAYQMLAAEGYVESRPRSGFVVLPFEGPAFAGGLYPGAHAARPAGPAAQSGGAGGLSAGGAGAGTPAGKPPAGAGRSDTAAAQSGSPARGRDGAECPAAGAGGWRYDLSTRGVDVGLFPFRTWGRIQRELLYTSPQLLHPGQAQGDAELREALADYLAAYRGVQCGPEQLVVGAGAEYLLGLLAPLLSGTAAVEDPCYPRARAIFENSGLPCRLIPVDEGGLSVKALAGSGADVCYVTPSHQFPTGVTMPAPRRAELLRWAAAAPGQRYIIEDDYDSEFRFDIRPLPSLQGMAGADGPVIYLSTCSRSLAPSIRIAYMVLPRPLLARWRQRYGLYSSTVSRYEQQTLARFIREGHFTRHLARMRMEYKRRRDGLTAALEAAFGRENLRLGGLHTGLHLLLGLQNGPPEAEMVARAAAAGVRLTGLSRYYHASGAACPPSTVVLGYGALPPSEAEAEADALKKAWRYASVSSENS